MKLKVITPEEAKRVLWDGKAVLCLNIAEARNTNEVEYYNLEFTDVGRVAVLLKDAGNMFFTRDENEA